MFATEHWDVAPDITTVAKQLTSGYMPIGAAIASKKIADAFIGDEERTFRHLITFGGNPASCAAGIANLKIIEEEGMVENSAKMGSYLYDQLQKLYEHSIVGDVRGGLGLMTAIEIVKDRGSKEVFPKEAKLAPKITRLMREHHVLGGLGRAGEIAICPPLCITQDEVDELVERIDSVLSKVESDL